MDGVIKLSELRLPLHVSPPAKGAHQMALLHNNKFTTKLQKK